MYNPGKEHIADKIFEMIRNPKDMANCRLVSKFWRDYIDSNNHWYNLQLAKILKRYKKLYKRDIEYEERIPCWIDVIKYFYNNKRCQDFEKFKLFTKVMMEYYFKLLKTCEHYWRWDMITPFHWAIWRHKSEPDEKKWMEFIRMLPLSSINFWEMPQGCSLLGEAIDNENKEVFDMIMDTPQWPFGDNWLNHSGK